MTFGGLRAVLFDFHNTLVSGDDWLRLEIHTLPREVLRMLMRDGALDAALVPDPLLDRADDLYRLVREEAKSSGSEVTALDGALRVLAQLDSPSVDEADVERAVEEAEQACLAGTAEISGARHAVEVLRDAGLRLAVVSSAAFPRFVRWGLARHGMERYFEVIATSAETGHYKSDPRLYHWALDRLGVRAAEAAHVGDHLRFDVLGAQRAGLRAIWYNPANEPPDDTRPDAIITSMQDLPAALKILAAQL